MPERSNVVVEEVNERKRWNGLIIGMIVCLITAVGGIGFGVWAMMDRNSQKEQLNKQISDLRKKIRYKIVN